MPERDRAPWGAPCWVDLQTSDLARAVDFYGTVLGWRTSPTGPQAGEDYLTFTRDGVPVAGVMPSAARDGAPGAAPDAVRNVWSTYLAVPDAADAVEVAVSAGALVLARPTAMGEAGVLAFLVDADGAGVGLWQPTGFPGFGMLGEPGSPVWFELHSRDYLGALRFYRQVFDWQTESLGDTDEFRYSRALVDGRPVAGVMDVSDVLPARMAPYWMFYAAVADVDHAVATALGLGGTVTEPAVDTSFGRLAGLTDPMGARFRVIAAATADGAGPAR